MPIHMASRYQRRLWRYVDSGHRHKLHRLLKHHRKALDLSEAVGHKSRTPLHRSCARLDHKTVVLLLEYGADPSIVDQRGNTAMHVAARHAARKKGTAYKDLFVPLLSRCPSAMGIRNRDGKTPWDLLGQTEERWCPQELWKERETEQDADREWNQKLLGEWEDENRETCWHYEEDFDTTSPDPESYEAWADRIAQEYRQKQRRVEEKPQQKPKTEPQKPSLKLRCLEEEHLLFEKRARAKEAELKEAKRRRYEEGCSQVFSADSSGLLSYTDIPWPCPKGTPEEMAAVAVHGIDPSDRAAYRRFIRRQQALWHPDKFAQRCGTRLARQDRRQILDTVTALSQAFNRLAEAAK